jgi:WD40-like Beta Propeller Repeat
VLCLVAAIACSRGRSVPRKTPLTRFRGAPPRVAVSDDGVSWAYIEIVGAEQRVVHDGITDELHPGCGSIVFSPVTRKLFYWAGSSTAGQLVAEGTKVGHFAKEGTIVFTRDGRRWATAAGGADEIEGGAIRPGQAVVVADGKEIGRHPDASVPTFSPDGRHLAYLAAAEGGTKLIVDGADRTAYRRPPAPCAAAMDPGSRRPPNFWPQFQTAYLSDGTLLVMTQDEDGWGIYREGSRIASYGMSLLQKTLDPRPDCPGLAGVAAWSLVTAEQAPVAAWWERLPGEKDAWRVVVNAKPADDVVCARPWLTQPPEFSPDGRHVAYACEVAEPEDRVFMVADGRRYGPYRAMWAYVWSDDGSHVAYGASVDESGERPWRYYVDGEPRTDGFADVWRPRLEPQTGRLVWEGKLDESDPRGVLGIEGRRLASFDEVLSGPTLSTRGLVTWVIRRGQRLVRLNLPTGG